MIRGLSVLMPSAEQELRARARWSRPNRPSGFADSIDLAAIRIVDFAVALTAIIALFPLLLAVMVVIYLTDPGPIIFAHRRVGRNGRLFPCFKFRTMVVDADTRLAVLLARDPQARAEWENDHKLRVDPRITRIGQFLRRSSIDELPQLFNVVRGEMSLVGPRPIVQAEVARYRRFFSDYATVKPGITGLWQVSGRNDTTYRRRVAMDVSYARQKSLLFDLKIVAMTIPAVLAAKGSY